MPWISCAIPVNPVTSGVCNRTRQVQMKGNKGEQGRTSEEGETEQSRMFQPEKEAIAKGSEIMNTREKVDREKLFPTSVNTKTSTHQKQSSGGMLRQAKRRTFWQSTRIVELIHRLWLGKRREEAAAPLWGSKCDLWLKKSLKCIVLEKGRANCSIYYSILAMMFFPWVSASGHIRNKEGTGRVLFWCSAVNLTRSFGTVAIQNNVCWKWGFSSWYHHYKCAYQGFIVFFLLLSIRYSIILWKHK